MKFWLIEKGQQKNILLSFLKTVFPVIRFFFVLCKLENSFLFVRRFFASKRNLLLVIGSDDHDNGDDCDDVDGGVDDDDDDVTER